MKYLVLTVAAVVGGFGSITSPDMQGNSIFVVILGVITVAGFAAACVRRLFQASRDR